jgi:hypothetical protein
MQDDPRKLVITTETLSRRIGRWALVLAICGVSAYTVLVEGDFWGLSTSLKAARCLGLLLIFGVAATTCLLTQRGEWHLTQEGLKFYPIFGSTKSFEWRKNTTIVLYSHSIILKNDNNSIKILLFMFNKIDRFKIISFVSDINTAIQ